MAESASGEADGITIDDAVKALEKMTGRGLLKTTMWALVVMFGTVLITMGGAVKYGYGRRLGGANNSNHHCDRVGYGPPTLESALCFQ